MDCSLPGQRSQAPARKALSMEFSRQEYWSGLPFLSPGDLPDSGIEPRSPTLQAVSYTASSLLHCRQILYGLSHQGSPIAINAYLIIRVQVIYMFLPKTISHAVPFGWSGTSSNKGKDNTHNAQLSALWEAGW